MRALINNKLLMDLAAQPRQKPFEICDSRLSGFTLRIQPSGVRSFYARFGRNRRFALGKADVRITRAVHALDMRASALTLRLRYFVTPTIAPLSF
jgi:hypothetical protein